MERKETLSKESEEFLENLSVYLFSSGKKMKESEEIVEELRIHLQEAEKNGKSVKNIIGSSPKEYIESISNEMENDFRSWIKYLFLIIFGSFSFIVFQDLIHGTLSYSVLQIVGHIAIVLLFIGFLFFILRFLAVSNLRKKTQAVLIILLSIIQLLLFVGLIYADRIFTTPIIHFGVIGSIVIFFIMGGVVIGISIWSRTWILPIIIFLLIVPELVLGLTSLSYEFQIITSTIITYIGFFIYFLIAMKRDQINVK